MRAHAFRETPLSTHDFLFPAGVELNKPTHFTVTTKGAGKANLDCSFSGATKGEAVKDFEIINNHDNTHTVKYTPVQQVGHLIRLMLLTAPPLL